MRILHNYDDRYNQWPHREHTSEYASGKPLNQPVGVSPCSNIAIWHQRMGRSVDEINTEYNLKAWFQFIPHLPIITTYREEIHRCINEGDDFIDDLRQSTPSVLEKRMKELRRG